eukprot:symbB.v1.2.018037.t1/scaffold1424.1/size119625/2
MALLLLNTVTAEAQPHAQPSAARPARPNPTPARPAQPNPTPNTTPNPASAPSAPNTTPNPAQRAQQGQIRAQPSPARPPACPVALRESSAWSEALDLFGNHVVSGVGRLDTICWNAALSACQKGACWNVGLHGLEEMRRARVNPNASSFNTLISACAESIAWPTALALLQNADVLGRGAAISACGRANQWQRAVALLEGYAGGAAPDRVTSNAVLSALAYASQWQLQLAYVLHQHGPPGEGLDSYGCVAVLSGLVQGVLWREAIDLMRGKVTGNADNAELFMMNSVIAACAKASQWDLSLQLLGSLDLWRLVPDAISLSAIFQAFQQRQQLWPHALHLAVAATAVTSSEMMNGVVGVLGSAQQWQRAMMILNQMVESKDADVVSFNATLWACEKAFQWQQCLSLLRWMEVMNAVPDSSSYLASASASQHCHFWEEALSLLRVVNLENPPVRMLRCQSFAVANWPGTLEVFEEMRWCGEADLPVLDTVLQALSRASSWSHALRLVTANAKMLDVNALQRGWWALEVQHQFIFPSSPCHHPWASERAVWKHLEYLPWPEMLDESQVPEVLWGLPPILARNVLNALEWGFECGLPVEIRVGLTMSLTGNLSDDRMNWHVLQALKDWSSQISTKPVALSNGLISLGTMQTCARFCVMDDESNEENMVQLYRDFSEDRTDGSGNSTRRASLLLGPATESFRTAAAQVAYDYQMPMLLWSIPKELRSFPIAQHEHQNDELTKVIESIQLPSTQLVRDQIAAAGDIDTGVYGTLYAYPTYSCKDFSVPDGYYLRSGAEFLSCGGPCNVTHLDLCCRQKSSGLAVSGTWSPRGWHDGCLRGQSLVNVSTNMSLILHFDRSPAHVVISLNWTTTQGSTAFPPFLIVHEKLYEMGSEGDALPENAVVYFSSPPEGEANWEICLRASCRELTCPGLFNRENFYCSGKSCTPEADTASCCTLEPPDLNGNLWNAGFNPVFDLVAPVSDWAMDVIHQVQTYDSGRLLCVASQRENQGILGEYGCFRK